MTARKAPAEVVPPDNELPPPPPWMSPVTNQPEPIHVLLGRVLAELPAIGKNQRNEQQKFNFRGIDDVLDELNPLLGKYGVFYVPTVIDRIEAERRSQADKPVYVVNLHVMYSFFGPGGDVVSASAWGEGTDSGDKATPKAMTGAMKAVLFQVFAVSVKEVSDNESDRGTPPQTVSAKMKGLADRLHALPDDLAERVESKIMTDAYGDNVPDFHVLEFDGDDKWMDVLDRMLTAAEKRAAAQPSDDTESQDKPTVSNAPEERPAEQTPDPNPEPAASSPEPEPEAAPGGGEEDSVEWDTVITWNSRKVKAEMAKLKNPPMLTGKEDVTALREAYWLAIGGIFEDPEEAATFQCVDNGCKAFPFSSQAELDEHMDSVHGFQGDPQQPAPPEETNVDGEDTEPVSEEVLNVLRPMLAELKGERARAYAQYRRSEGLPSKPDDLTNIQAIDLVTYLEELPA